MTEKIPKPLFKPMAKPPFNGVALIFDLEGFSAFFAQPDVQTYVPLFLNRVFDCMHSIVEGGEAYWMPQTERLNALAPPDHFKFLGDGGLYVWKIGDGGSMPEDMLGTLINRVWNLKSNFHRILAACSDDVPVADLPKRIRFGVARGTFYELTRDRDVTAEYI